MLEKSRRHSQLWLFSVHGVAVAHKLGARPMLLGWPPMGIPRHVNRRSATLLESHSCKISAKNLLESHSCKKKRGEGSEGAFLMPFVFSGVKPSRMRSYTGFEPNSHRIRTYGIIGLQPPLESALSKKVAGRVSDLAAREPVKKVFHNVYWQPRNQASTPASRVPAECRGQGSPRP